MGLSITVNDNPHQLDGPCTVVELLIFLDQPAKGVAVAINDNIVSRSQWQQHQLKANDQVMLFKAIAGG
ncbi:sulfur carrier protein ThiS [Endozoicomonas sp. SM1973]|uniref:Sulfur carrier protein ThiS n=1 Tax=Spartinivicinus marinus TaxID=2994442 RepID=A0A853I6G9_9GAMM|nr:sulfur carrier protein ThiS [Spartinivicinus marinus]MCX4028575.1 sulfur carrier protein ThiS [Spartinivicinus marinus]NYZ67242.1 sulfur carrier protein ThiS [Spartinivicinus marinus]